MLVPGQHEVDLVLIEQRQPGLADAEVGPVRHRARQRALVHEDDDHVYVVVLARLAEGALEPERLQVRRATGEVRPGREVLFADLQVAGVAAVVGHRAVGDLRAGRGGHRRGVRRAPHVARGAVLIDHVVGVQRDEQHGADLERVEVAAQPVAIVVDDAVVRQEEAAQVVAVAVGAVPVVARGALGADAAFGLAWLACVVAGTEVGLVVAERRHPGAVGRRPGDVDAEVAPDAGGVRVVEVRVGDVAVQQVE